MFNLNFSITFIILINIYTHIKIIKDTIYFLDKEKTKYILIVWFLPIIGAIICLYRLNINRLFYVGVALVYWFLKYIYYYMIFY